jgi:type IV secretory pathway TrbF-like protein
MSNCQPIRSYSDLRSSEAPHPYLDARALRVNASLRRQRLLQVLAASTLVLAAGLVAALSALIASGNDHRITPYLVRVQDDGAVVGVDPLTAAAEPTRPMIHHALRLFILNSRTVTSDRTAQRQLILRAYGYATGRAVGVLNDYYRTNPPFAGASRATVTPRITSFLRLSDRDVFQVEWVEEVRNLNGALLEELPWRALVTVTVEPPESISDALINPLGIKVSDLDFQPLATLEP